MTTTMTRLAKGTASIAIIAVIASCSALPRSGPNRSEIYSGSVAEQGDAFVLSVDDRVNMIANVTPGLGFNSEFRNAGPLADQILQPGDTLTVRIWENVDDGLLVPTTAKNVLLEDVQIDSAGFIFVPYAERIRAAGNTTEAVRRIITTRLEEQTPDPQVEVALDAGDGATVAVVGALESQGVYPIERPTRTLTSMIARAGGISVDPELAVVTVVRGGHSGSIWLTDLFDHAGHDIALRGGDRVYIEEDTRTFTALGATGVQNAVEFDHREISAIEALARVGGLSTAAADPTGVFVLRNEPAAIANRLLGRTDLTGMQRVVYVHNLTRPNGMFFARDFDIRDGDTVYVTEAPITQFNKVVAALTGTLSAVDVASSVGSE